LAAGLILFAASGATPAHSAQTWVPNSEIKPLWQDSAWDHGGPELAYGTPPFRPDHITKGGQLRYTNLFDREREMYSYNPRFMPTHVDFDSDNLPWFFFGNQGSVGSDGRGTTHVAWGGDKSTDYVLLRLFPDGRWRQLSYKALIGKLTGLDERLWIIDRWFGQRHVYIDNDGDVFFLAPGYVVQHCRAKDAWTVYRGDTYRRAFNLLVFKAIRSDGTRGLPPLVGSAGIGQFRLFLFDKDRKSHELSVAERSVLVPGYGLDGGVAIRVGDHVHVSGLQTNPREPGITPQLYVRYNVSTEAVDGPYDMVGAPGFGPNGNRRGDNHNRPVIVLDSRNRLHYISGHHDGPVYYRATSVPVSDREFRPAPPDDMSRPNAKGWSRRIDLGGKDETHAYTYVHAGIDKNDAMHLFLRNMAIDSRAYTEHGYSFQTHTLDYLRATPNANEPHTWEDVNALVVSAHSGYCNYQHRTASVDRDGSLFVPFGYEYHGLNLEHFGTPQARQVSDRLWGTEMFTDGHKQNGLFDPSMLLSTDAGRTWRLATTEEFLARRGPSRLKAWATAAITSGPAPLKVQFIGSASGSADDCQYSWDFGDGDTSDEQNPVHVYQRNSVHVATLTVRDRTHMPVKRSVVIEVPGEEMVLRWDMDQSYGNVLRDASGHHNDAECAQPKRWAINAGVAGNAIETQWRTHLRHNYLDYAGDLMDRSRFTVSFWYNRNGASRGNIGQWSDLRRKPNTLYFGFWGEDISVHQGDRKLTARGQIRSTQWHHVVYTFKRGADRRGSGILYVDGELVARSEDLAVPNDWVSMNIGSGPHGEMEGVLVDEVRVYSRVLDNKTILRMKESPDWVRDTCRLTVNQGTGSGVYTAAERISISADTIPDASFVKWEGDTQYLAGSESATTTVTMASSDVMVTPIYRKTDSTQREVRRN